LSIQALDSSICRFTHSFVHDTTGLTEVTHSVTCLLVKYTIYSFTVD